jgi:hypothetical protein
VPNKPEAVTTPSTDDNLQSSVEGVTPAINDRGVNVQDVADEEMAVSESRHRSQIDDAALTHSKCRDCDYELVREIELVDTAHNADSAEAFSEGPGSADIGPS